MDTFVNQVHSRRRRRQYSEEFKRDAVAACMAPGVSMASVALANGLNANVLRRWVNEHETTSHPSPVMARRRSQFPPSFQSNLGVSQHPFKNIKLELRTGAVLLNITWHGL